MKEKLKQVGWWCSKCETFLHYKGDRLDTPEAVYYNCRCRMLYKKRAELKNAWYEPVFIIENKKCEWCGGSGYYYPTGDNTPTKTVCVCKKG